MWVKPLELRCSPSTQTRQLRTATAAWAAPVLAALAGLAGAVPGSLVSDRAAQALGPFERILPSPRVYFGYAALLTVAIPVLVALMRAPPHLGRELLAMEAEDHDLRVHTSVGSDLLLMRMRDAVTELAPPDGLRVHRSRWVTRTGVERAARNGTGLALPLRSGLTVPVARAQRRAVREWLGA